MKKLEFTADDFSEVYKRIMRDGYSSKGAGDMWEPEMCVEDIAYVANTRLAEMLKDAKVVYSRADDGTSAWWPQKPYRDVNVQGLLINVEELAKTECKHQIIEYMVTGRPVTTGKCANCKADMVAEWKEATR